MLMVSVLVNVEARLPVQRDGDFEPRRSSENITGQRSCSTNRPRLSRQMCGVRRRVSNAARPNWTGNANCARMLRHRHGGDRAPLTKPTCTCRAPVPRAIRLMHKQLRLRAGRRFGRASHPQPAGLQGAASKDCAELLRSVQ